MYHEEVLTLPNRKRSAKVLYGDAPPQDKPRYTLAQAARYLHLSPSTLRSWIRGRDYPKGSTQEHWPRLIQAGDLLSFNNLIEAHVLRALRVDHKVRMPAVREALDYAQREFGIERLLLSRELLAAPGNVFLERFGQLINLGKSGQLAARHLLEAHLHRVEWDLAGLPARLFPVGSYDVETLNHARKLIVIDPKVSFGRPVLVSRGIRTSAVVDRIDAGESLEVVAQDYQLEPDEIEAAILYEKTAA